MRNWDDLRVFLAVRRHGTHAAAGHALRVAPTTIGRRITALEGTFGARLFRRTRAGLVVTDAGIRLAERAERIEAEALAAERELAGAERSLEGLVRITAGDGIIASVLAPALGELFSRHPKLRLELRGEFKTLDMDRSEVDVALRLSRPTSGSLVAKRLGTMRFGLFASEAYLARHGRPTSETQLADHDLLAYDGGLDKAPFMAWFLARAKKPVRIRSNTTSGMVAACAAGQGIAIAIPEAVRHVPGVVEVLPRAPIPTLDAWGLIHSDMRKSARLAAVLAWMASAVTAANR